MAAQSRNKRSFSLKRITSEAFIVAAVWRELIRPKHQSYSTQCEVMCVWAASYIIYNGCKLWGLTLFKTNKEAVCY